LETSKSRKAFRAHNDEGTLVNILPFSLNSCSKDRDAIEDGTAPDNREFAMLRAVSFVAEPMVAGNVPSNEFCPKSKLDRLCSPENIW
jgi:hypothetical protein